MDIKEDKVRWPSQKKYACKRNKGEHEYSEPVIIYKPAVRYTYETADGFTIDTPNPRREYKHGEAHITLATETRCKHCGKKVLTFFKDRL